MSSKRPRYAIRNAIRQIQTPTYTKSPEHPRAWEPSIPEELLYIDKVNITNNMTQDEIAISVGADPALACELAQTLSNAHGSAVMPAAMPEPPPPKSSVSAVVNATPSAAVADPAAKTAVDDPPKKKAKAKAPKPQAWALEVNMC